MIQSNKSSYTAASIHSEASPESHLYSSLILFMARSPISMPDITIDFRAPPPSPVASGRRSSVTNDDVLTEFLETSLRVPDLVLPDKIFPKQKYLETPPKVDFRSLCFDEDSALCDVVLDSMSRIGCFQLANHGIPRELVISAVEAAKGVFRVSTEKKAAATRSPENPYGYEEYHVEEEGSAELNEEFVWCRDENLKLKMQGIWPMGYLSFSKKMETLGSSIEKVAEKILQVIMKNFPRKSASASTIDMTQAGHEVGTVCCVYKHSRDNMADRLVNTLKYDVIRMLIRGTDYTHSLCLHVCDGSSEFHVYSKKGWLSFCPERGALIITGGDQIQTLSGGHYKHVMGRPIFEGEKEDSISMAFLCCPPIPDKNIKSFQTNSERTISLGQQAILFIILTLLYHVFVYVYQML